MRSRVSKALREFGLSSLIFLILYRLLEMMDRYGAPVPVPAVAPVLVDDLGLS